MRTYKKGRLLFHALLGWLPRCIYSATLWLQDNGLDAPNLVLHSYNDFSNGASIEKGSLPHLARYMAHTLAGALWSLRRQEAVSLMLLDTSDAHPRRRLWRSCPICKGSHEPLDDTALWASDTSCLIQQGTSYASISPYS